MAALGGLKDLTVAMKAARLVKEELMREEESRKPSGDERDYSLTTKDVARMFGVHEKTINRWRRQLGLPSKKFGRSVKFRQGDVRRWAAQRKEG